MKRVVVAFDVDGTLRDAPRPSADKLIYKIHPDISFMMITLSRMKNVKIIVWSSRGKAYAEEMVRRFHWRKYVWRVEDKSPEVAAKYNVDIAFDDEHSFNLANVNIIVRNK